ncbi:hypothetical protein ABAC460_21115 [Asticcacaulis sp. AC460]|nr:hypothetical protein ABAC460_21115 [Asticcacaulis sp. AC460]
MEAWIDRLQVPAGAKRLGLPLLAAVVLVVVAQLIVWGLVTGAEQLSRPPGMAATARVEYRLKDADGKPMAPAFATSSGSDGYVVTAGEGDTGIVFSIPFQVEDPAKPLALYLSIRELVHEIRVNGQLIQPQLALGRIQGVANSEPGLYTLPAQALTAGRNVITVEQTRYGYAYALPEFTVGSAEALSSAYRWKSFFMVDLALGGMFILVFTSLLVLVIDWPAGDRRRARSLVVFLLSSAVVTWLFSFTPPFDMGINVTVYLLCVAGIGNALAALHYVLCDVGAAEVWRRRVWQAALAGLGVLTVALLAGMVKDDLGRRLAYLTLDVSHYVVIAVCVAAVMVLAAAIAVTRPSRWPERLVVMVCLSTFILDRAGSLTDLTSPFAPDLPLTLYLSPIVGALLGLAMLLSIARQAGEARRVVATANDVLETTLKAREAELDAVHARQSQILQRHVLLEERQRIVRDMHDGIGGQLLGLMLQVRGRRLSVPVIEAALQTSMDDLRLIVDSLDSAEESLLAALRAFEYRARAQIEAAGFAFEVDLAFDAADVLRPGPRASLQILRILQEAVSNALRHSGGGRITLTGRRDGDNLTLSLGDDGKGFASDRKGGLGLNNMKARAGRLGGRIDIASGEDGTRVTFAIALGVLNALVAEEVML